MKKLIVGLVAVAVGAGTVGVFALAGNAPETKPVAPVTHSAPAVVAPTHKAAKPASHRYTEVQCKAKIDSLIVVAFASGKDVTVMPKQCKGHEKFAIAYVTELSHETTN